jgi:hypothetical protein
VVAVPGIVTVERPAGAGITRRVAINVDPAESDGARLTVPAFEAAITRINDEPAAPGQIEARQQEDNQHIWRYLLGLMFAILALESFVAARTV